MFKQGLALAVGLGLAIFVGGSLGSSAYSGELKSAKQAPSTTESSKGWNKPGRYKSSRRHGRWGHRYHHLR
jgi:hypothetical protein